MQLEIVLELIVFAGLMGLSAFFSSSETALFSLGPLEIEQMRRTRNPRIGLIEDLLSKPRQLIVTILIGNEFVNVSASVISASLVIDLMGGDKKWVNLLIMVPILLLVGEITPKTLAIRNGVAFASYQCRFIDLFARAISPLRWVIRQIADFFITLIVGRERSQANIITQDMVRSLAQEAVGDGVLDRAEALYINRIFDFGDKTLRDVMTPRSRIAFLPANSRLEEAARHYRRTGHTKVPVYDKSRDNVVGVLYARDLLDYPHARGNAGRQGMTVADIAREAFVVPESKLVADLFYTFRKRKLSLALIVDEYGGLIGLVTMEDLLECIFGEILSPSEMLQERTVSLEQTGTNEHRIGGTMTIRQFNRLFDAGLRTDAAETVGGLLLHAFGEIPPEKARIMVADFEFEVEAISEQRIAELTVRPDAAPEPLSEDNGPLDEEARPGKPGGAGSSTTKE